MSIKPCHALLENTQTRAPELEEELPPQLIAKAKAAAREFFQDQELKVLTSQRTQDWVVERIAPAMAHIEKANSHITERDATLFLENVSKQIIPMMTTLGNISFSRGHETDHYTYPSVDEFNEISHWLDNLRDGYQSHKKIPGFSSKFCEIFTPFFDTLITTAREEALLSRNLQLEKILSDPTHPEFDFKKAVTAAHIDALNNKPMQPLLELRDLLNLSRNSKINRTPTMEEQRGFQFLLDIFSLREKNRP
ncbi:MAG: hypothetical protein Q8L98_06840 [Chlamydiales bacterium]|nr:hypothetical protein [Chlamydiales bacterium]